MPMFAERTTAEPTGWGSRVLLQWAPVVVVVGLVSLAAWWAFPSWDDALFWLAATERGPESLRAMVPDRPVLGYILGWLAGCGFVVPGAILYVASWVGTAWIARSYWETLFPEWRRFGVAVAVLSVAPVLVETHTVAVNPVVGAQAGTVLVYAAMLLVHRSRRYQLPVSVAAAAIVLLSVSISEYAVLATIVSALVLASAAGDSVVAASSSRWRRCLVFCGIAIVGYVAFRLIGDPTARPEVNPEHRIASDGLKQLLGMVVRVPLSLWHAVLGELLKDLGEINISRATAAGLPCGGVVALLIWFGLRRAPSPAAAAEDPSSIFWRGVRVVAVFTMGLALITFMTTTIRANFETRLWMPLLPIASCLTMWTLLLALRRRGWSAGAVLVGFVSGYLAANAAAGARSIRSDLSRLGRELHGRLAPNGLTVALFVNQPTNHAIGDPIARPYELMAALTRDWPDSDRRKFWAGAYEWQPLRSSVPGMEGVCGPVRRVELEARGWNRSGSVARTLWVSFDPDGGSHIEDLVMQTPDR